MERKIVIPGTLLGKIDGNKQGRGTFREGKNIYSSRLGILEEKSGYLNVISLSGVYDPSVGDTVIGVIKEASKMSWMADINAPYPALLRADEVPWRVEFGEASHFLNTGEVIIADVMSINEARNIEISMRGKHCRKVEEGVIVEIQPSKVPRVIGKNGSMVSLLRQGTRCWIFVGQNGRVWIKGKDDKMAILVEAIHKIEKEAHTTGLTDKISKFLESKGD
ncbi:MAG: exosome complex RNA-binding protein Rrp4 [Candidatus Thermoplasmatota archaeon]|nr:exosome complex RNA-binding protein Rrp4 [Candidatus Thermoplasmatota archaeon]